MGTVLKIADVVPKKKAAPKTRDLMENMYLRGRIYWVRCEKDGKEFRVSTGQSDYKLAKRRAIEILKGRNDGEMGWTTTTMPVFEAAAQRYIDIYHSATAKDEQHHRNALARAMDFWHGRKLDSITPSDCQQYCNWRMAEQPRPGEKERRAADGPAGANNTVLHETVIVGAVFTMAVGDGLIKRTPWTNKVKRPDGITRERTLSREEQAQLVTTCTEEYQRLLVCYLGTGLRADEMHQVEPDDIDFKRGVVDLPKEKTKGKKKGRIIPLFPEVATAFKTQIDLRASGAKLRVHGGAGKRKNQTAIFNMLRATALQVFHKAARDADMNDDFTLHDLRRTFGTRCAEAAMPIKHLSVVMGHSSIEVTAKYYIHLGDDNLKSTMLALDLGLTPQAPAAKGPTLRPRMRRRA